MARKNKCSRCKKECIPGKKMCAEHLEYSRKWQQAYDKSHYIRSTKGPDGLKDFFSKTDWNKTDREIASDLDCTVVRVFNYRRRTCRKPFSKTRWESVDWTQDDIVIAENMGASPSAVRHQRRNRGLKHPKKQRWEKADWSLSDASLAFIFDVHPMTVRYQRNKRNKND